MNLVEASRVWKEAQERCAIIAQLPQEEDTAQIAALRCIKDLLESPAFDLSFQRKIINYLSLDGVDRINFVTYAFSLTALAEEQIAEYSQENYKNPPDLNTQECAAVDRVFKRFALSVPLPLGITHAIKHLCALFWKKIVQTFCSTRKEADFKALLTALTKDSPISDKIMKKIGNAALMLPNCAVLLAELCHRLPLLPIKFRLRIARARHIETTLYNRCYLRAKSLPAEALLQQALASNHLDQVMNNLRHRSIDYLKLFAFIASTPSLSQDTRKMVALSLHELETVVVSSEDYALLLQEAALYFPDSAEELFQYRWLSCCTDFEQIFTHLDLNHPQIRAMVQKHLPATIQSIKADDSFDIRNVAEKVRVFLGSGALALLPAPFFIEQKPWFEEIIYHLAPKYRLALLRLFPMASIEAMQQLCQETRESLRGALPSPNSYISKLVALRCLENLCLSSTFEASFARKVIEYAASWRTTLTDFATSCLALAEQELVAYSQPDYERPLPLTAEEKAKAGALLHKIRALAPPPLFPLHIPPLSPQEVESTPD
jgi:hypothetical protein